MTDEERTEAEALWAAVGEGPMPPTLAADDLPGLRLVVYALKD